MLNHSELKSVLLRNYRFTSWSGLNFPSPHPRSFSFIGPIKKDSAVVVTDSKIRLKKKEPSLTHRTFAGLISSLKFLNNFQQLERILNAPRTYKTIHLCPVQLARVPVKTKENHPLD